jgi:hypothetical protein
MIEDGDFSGLAVVPDLASGTQVSFTTKDAGGNGPRLEVDYYLD